MAAYKIFLAVIFNPLEHALELLSRMENETQESFINYHLWFPFSRLELTFHVIQFADCDLNLSKMNMNMDRH